ncbi:MAG: 3-dehydroquinate synthase [Planctomycetota bacterium]|nr:3-dehydroquinate synthase [Planctomycetota bacterium]
MQRTVTVDLGSRSYEVRIGPGELNTLGAFAAGLDSVSNAVVVSDTQVARLYGERAIGSLGDAGMTASLLSFAAGEQHKTLATYGRLLDELLALSPPIDRDSLVVALGGGVVGDVAGFVAATALRGLRWLQCPTTLLADVDASVGGKTAVDHPAGKNLIGAFHQPAGVLIDTETLTTLPPEQTASGLAECVKHAVIRDAELLVLLEENADAILACRPDVMGELIARNVAIKAAVVSDDERETGVRSHLNLGHTVGHAIEVTVGYRNIGHGQAVAIGMAAACRMAVHRKLIKLRDAERVEKLLGLLGLPVRLAGLDAEQIWLAMQHDKKVRGGKVRMVLPTRLGAVDVFDDVTPEQVRKVIRELQ